MPILGKLADPGTLGGKEGLAERTGSRERRKPKIRVAPRPEEAKHGHGLASNRLLHCVSQEARSRVKRIVRPMSKYTDPE